MAGYVVGGSPTVEPEGFELEHTVWHEPCPQCQALAIRWRIESNDCGCINVYRGLRCRHCGHLEGEHPSDPW